MAKQGKNILFTLGIVALVGFFLIRQSVKIDIGSPSVSFLQVAGDGIRINVKLPILNRGAIAYPIEGFLGQLLYGGTALGNITLKQPVSIPARGTAAPEFVALINWGALASEVYTALQTAGVVNWLLSKIGLATPTPGTAVAWKDFRVRGTLYVGGIAVDIDQNLA